jgi:predicted CoA-binding protein
MTTPDLSLNDDATLRRILQQTRVIAVVGLSLNPVRPSYFVARYLGLRGFRVIPVNPGHVGETLFGETVRSGLADCPDDVDMIDVFRRSDHVAPIVAQAIERFAQLRTIWLQIGVESTEAKAMAQAHGLNFVQNRCPKIEYQRLFGELRMGGFNTGVISSRL